MQASLKPKNRNDINMKVSYILTFGLIIILTSCGENIEKKENIQKELAKQNEIERLHLEKIEVGKDIQRRNLKNELAQVKGKLKEAKKELQKIREFQIGRSSATKDRQIEETQSEINLMQEYISNIEEEIPLINLHQTFEFQQTPKGLIEYVFSASKTKDFSKFRHLCDPYGENDSDSGGICYLQMMPKDAQKEIIERLENGRIIGEPNIDNNRASIEVAIGKKSDELVKINLVKRNENWFISSL